MTPGAKERELMIDVRRAIILGGYCSKWGMPDWRVQSRRKDDLVEVYSFPAGPQESIHRFATVGISSIPCDDGSLARWELFVTLPSALCSDSPQDVTNLILDLAVYSLRSDVKFAVGEAIPESSLVPASWAAKAFLLDEPRGEPEELSNFHIGTQHVDLIWVVPIYSDEFQLIKTRGLDAFDRLEALSEWSLADPNRPSVVALR